MSPRFKITATLASLVVLTIALRCAWLWQPGRQLLIHQARLRHAIEGRDWSRVGSLIDPAYSDHWGYTRETGLLEARQWLGQFFALTITVQPVSDALSPSGGTITERWQLDGTGTEAAGMVKDRVNAVTTPFTFEWKHEGWKPWAWTLVRVDNPSLDLSASDAGF